MAARAKALFEEYRRNRPELANVVPSELDLQSAPSAIVRKASHPAVIDINVGDRQRTHDVIAVHNPMPTSTAPMGFWRVMVDAVSRSFWLSCDHK